LDRGTWAMERRDRGRTDPAESLLDAIWSRRGQHRKDVIQERVPSILFNNNGSRYGGDKHRPALRCHRSGRKKRVTGAHVIARCKQTKKALADTALIPIGTSAAIAHSPTLNE